MVSIIDLKHIGYAYKEKLASIGINTTEMLLEKASTPQGRLYIEENTEICNNLLLKWVRLSGLLSIEGIDQDYSALLMELGIGSCTKLSEQDPARLKMQMQTLNEKRNIVAKLPTFLMLKGWIEQAASLASRTA